MLEQEHFQRRQNIALNNKTNLKAVIANHLGTDSDLVVFRQLCAKFHRRSPGYHSAITTNHCVGKKRSQGELTDPLQRTIS